MSKQKHVNNYRTALTTSATDTDTTLDLDDVSRVPLDISADEPLLLTLVPAGVSLPTLADVEVVEVTAVDPRNRNVTVNRGQDGTTAKAWSSGDTVGARATARSFDRSVQGASFNEQKAVNANVSPNGIWLTNNPTANYTPAGPTAAGSTVTGDTGLASGINSHAEGHYGQAEAESSHAEGYFTYAQGKSSHAEGKFTYAENPYSHAEGDFTYARANYSHSEGRSTKAEGRSSHAEGQGAQTVGSYSHAEGRYTTANSYYSHAEGHGSETTGSAAHAEGYYTTAAGRYSHAAGKRSVADADYSYATGYGGYALQPYGESRGAYRNLTTGTLVNHFGIRQPVSARTSDGTQVSMSPGVTIAAPSTATSFDGSAFSLKGRVVAAGGGYFAHWSINAFGFHNGGVDTLQSNSVVQEGYTGGASTWDLAVSVANGKVYLDVTGAASTDIDWSGLLYGPQVNRADGV